MLKSNIGGYQTSDDCSIYPINDNELLIQSVDFFTPIVDDPYDFGRIAAANALSDIYAMGGKPIFALNITCFPTDDLPIEVLHQILKGGNDIAKNAGIPILGGHSIKDKEPKYGLVVTGIVNKKHKFYSPLSLYLILDFELEKDKGSIIKLFDKVIAIKKIDKENINLIKINNTLEQIVMIKIDYLKNNLLFLES